MVVPTVTTNKIGIGFTSFNVNGNISNTGGENAYQQGAILFTLYPMLLSILSRRITSSSIPQ